MDGDVVCSDDVKALAADDKAVFQYTTQPPTFYSFLYIINSCTSTPFVLSNRMLRENLLI